MAAPTLDSFCCQLDEHSQKVTAVLAPYFHSTTYTAVCLTFALGGVCGAAYQILQSHVILETSEMQRRSVFTGQGRRILRWLAFADLMAALAVVLRCVAWLSDAELITYMGLDEFASDFCIVTSAVAQFFYTSSYLWTLAYAVHVHQTLSGRQPIPLLAYGLVAWLVPSVLATVGFLLLFIPGNHCHARGQDSFLRQLPNYLCVYAPLLLVMVACPLLVYRSLHHIRARIANTCSRFSNRERRTLLYLRFKFVGVVAAFHLCWLPNIVNGLLLWSTWPDVPVRWAVVVWYFMAVLNPSQAVFNALLYRSWDGRTPSVLSWLVGRVRASAAWWQMSQTPTSTRAPPPPPPPLMEPLLPAAGAKGYNTLTQ